MRNFETRRSRGSNLPWALLLSAYSLTRHAHYRLNETGFVKLLSFDQKFGRRLHQTTLRKPAEVSLLSFHFASSWETSPSREVSTVIGCVLFVYEGGKFKTNMARVPTNLASSSRTGEYYWPTVVFARTSLRLIRTVTTSYQYSPVRPSCSVSRRSFFFSQASERAGILNPRIWLGGSNLAPLLTIINFISIFETFRNLCVPNFCHSVLTFPRNICKLECQYSV